MPPATLSMVSPWCTLIDARTSGSLLRVAGHRMIQLPPSSSSSRTDVSMPLAQIGLVAPACALYGHISWNFAGMACAYHAPFGNLGSGVVLAGSTPPMAWPPYYFSSTSWSALDLYRLGPSTPENRRCTTGSSRVCVVQCKLNFDGDICRIGPSRSISIRGLARSDDQTLG